MNEYKFIIRPTENDGFEIVMPEIDLNTLNEQSSMAELVATVLLVHADEISQHAEDNPEEFKEMFFEDLKNELAERK